jgi:nitrogen fixation/metabolism regulation signal transduction histidine kinase
VREVAERHGGEVSLHDNPASRGLLVQVMFPLRDVVTQASEAVAEDLPLR